MMMETTCLDAEDLDYVADMLRAISWAQTELGVSSQEMRAELEDAWGAAEAALRRGSLEMSTSKITPMAEKPYGSFGLG